MVAALVTWHSLCPICFLLLLPWIPGNVWWFPPGVYENGNCQVDTIHSTITKSQVLVINISMLSKYYISFEKHNGNACIYKNQIFWTSQAISANLHPVVLDAALGHPVCHNNRLIDTICGCRPFTTRPANLFIFCVRFNMEGFRDPAAGSHKTECFRLDSSWHRNYSKCVQLRPIRCKKCASW